MTPPEQINKFNKWVPKARMKADHLVLVGTGRGRVWGTLVYKDGKCRNTNMRIDTLHREYRLAALAATSEPER